MRRHRRAYIGSPDAINRDELLQQHVDPGLLRMCRDDFNHRCIVLHNLWTWNLQDRTSRNLRTGDFIPIIVPPQEGAPEAMTFMEGITLSDNDEGQDGDQGDTEPDEGSDATSAPQSCYVSFMKILLTSTMWRCTTPMANYMGWDIDDIATAFRVPQRVVPLSAIGLQERCAGAELQLLRQQVVAPGLISAKL